MFQQKSKDLKTFTFKDLKVQNKGSQNEIKWSLFNLDSDLFRIDSFLTSKQYETVSLKSAIKVRTHDNQNFDQIDLYLECQSEAENWEVQISLLAIESSI